MAAEPAGSARARVIAAQLARYGTSTDGIRFRGLLGGLSGRAIPASLLEEQLDVFMRAGWVGLIWKTRGTRRTLDRVRLCDLDALEDFARPGQREERRRALAQALATVAPLEHPVGSEIGRLLADNRAEHWEPSLVRALAALALHAESGEVLASRVFSARYLGNSKALEALRSRLEKLLGRLDALGIRDGAAATFLGGSGRLRVGGVELDLVKLGPFVGLARDALASPIEIDMPPDGLFLAENFAVFEACCRGEVAETGDALFVWTMGYPGRGVRSIVQEAVRRGARVRIWADLDLDGIRIARLVASWAPQTIEAFRMSAEDVTAASTSRLLTSRLAAAIRADLAERPSAFLTDTLRALVAANRCIEQEAFLGGR